MKNLVTINDFVGEFAISGRGFALDTFNEFIAQKQYEALTQLLGYKYYLQFESALLAEPIPTFWNNFLVGANYTDICCNEPAIYQGVKSFLVPYIYMKFIEFNQFHVLNVGSVESNSQNTELLSQFRIRDIAYRYFNMFVQKYNESYNFLYSNRNEVPDICDYTIKQRCRAIVEKNSIK